MTDLSTKKENKDLPLVTVFVITYNSAETILDALESVKNQTYPNIELVISDDHSKDNTVELCKKWIEQNKLHFTNTVLVTSEKNTGVAPNCNRAVKASSGEWLKVLAGDDMLLPNAIEEYIKFIKENPNSEIVFAKLKFFGNNLNLVEEESKKYETKFYPKIKLSQKEQYIENLKGLFLPGPGLFFSRKLYNEIGGYDENYPMCEEDPFTSYVLEKKNHIKFLDKELYSYRITNKSLCRDKKKLSLHELDRKKFFFDYKRKKLINNNLRKFAFKKKIIYKKQEINKNDFLSKLQSIYFRILIKIFNL